MLVPLKTHYYYYYYSWEWHSDPGPLLMVLARRGAGPVGQPEAYASFEVVTHAGYAPIHTLVTSSPHTSSSPSAIVGRGRARSNTQQAALRESRALLSAARDASPR
jgi:hypothetical protein